MDIDALPTKLQLDIWKLRCKTLLDAAKNREGVSHIEWAHEVESLPDNTLAVAFELDRHRENTHVGTTTQHEHVGAKGTPMTETSP